MTSEDKIHLLTEAVCNLVRAQEVVSNPASAVKELLDNAIDAGASSIQLAITASGKESIHVIDNGCGMSTIDARMAFERHATSKIRLADDLERIQTLGFRGEGLASIAAVSKVELRTRRPQDEIGTEILISGGDLIKQGQVVTPIGTSIKMSDVFFNVPGRRRSLKKDSIEERLIDAEFTQCVLAHPKIAFRYAKGGKLFRELPSASLKERIIAVAGRSLEKKLLNINYESPNICIVGFIAHPEEAVRTNAKQFFFVNGRYIKHDYFRKAIELVYEPLVPSGHHPHYFVYFTVPSEHVDINIHPSKKEVRFIDEPYIWELLKSLVRETLSANAAIPMIDFDNPSTINLPPYISHSSTSPDHLDGAQREPSYTKRVFMGRAHTSGIEPSPFRSNRMNSSEVDWETLSEQFIQGETDKANLFAPTSDEPSEFNPNATQLSPMQHGFFLGSDYPTTGLLIYKGKYIVSSLRRSLALIDFSRAHRRVLYDRYLLNFVGQQIETQALLFPEPIDCSLDDEEHIEELTTILASYGFAFGRNEESGERAILEAPAVIADQAREVVLQLLSRLRDAESDNPDWVAEELALTCSRARAHTYGKSIERHEVDDLLAQLFCSSNPNYDPEGRLIIHLIEEEDIERHFY